MIRRWIWMVMARLLRPQVIWLTVAWALWVTHLADRLMLVLLRRCPMRLMLPLAPRWMVPWIKVVLQPRLTTLRQRCPQMTQALRAPTMTQSRILLPEWVNPRTL